MKKITCLLGWILSFFCFQVAHSVIYAQDSISVLFIGNSYTYVNDLPGTLGALAANLGKEITIDSKTNGGYTFQNHTTDPLTYSKIHSKPWNVVVIQGQSQEPSFPDGQVNSETLPYAVQLSDSVWASNTCSNVMYYMTWGRQNGDPQWSEINTFEKMNTRLYNAYMRIADSSDRAMVSPVGRAWAYVRTNHPTINLYNADESHPSMEGTYLAACTFYASLFQQSPVGSNYYAGLDATTAGILQHAAAVVVLDSLDHFHLHPVDEPTQAHFSFVQTGQSIQFVNESSRAIAYFWDFGDGQNAVSENAQHTFGSGGNYTVQLIASSSCNVDTFSVQLTTLGVYDHLFDGINLKANDEFIELTSSGGAFLIRSFGIDGKLLTEQVLSNENPLRVSRINQVQVLHLTDSWGFEKVIRIF